MGNPIGVLGVEMEALCLSGWVRSAEGETWGLPVSMAYDGE